MAPLNIAIFTDCYFPVKNGVVTSIAQLKAGLAARGHRVIVFTAAVKGYTETDPDVIRFRSVPIGLGTELSFALVDQARVNRIIRSENIQLVHSHTEFNLCLSAMLAARKFKLPRVQTNHTMWEEYTHYLLNGRLVTAPIVRFFVRRLFRGCAGLVAPSIKAAKYYGDLLPGIPIRVIPNGMDRDRFESLGSSEQERAETRGRLGIDSGDRVMLFVGRIGREKRVLELLQALLPVLRSDPRNRLIYAGDGPELNELKRRLINLGLENQVLLTGYVAWDAIGRIYAIADLFATASLSEVHPMTVLEALICSLPVVARKDDSLLDSVDPGVNGYLLDSDEAFSEKVSGLLADPDKLRRFGEASRRIADHFTGQRHALSMEAFYQEILHRFEKHAPAAQTA